MREIKFRGLRTDGKGWVYGMLFHNNKIVTETVSYESPLVQKGSPCYKYDYINIIPESVGQFTGLCDKNGKDIYDSDIVEYDDTPYNAYGIKRTGIIRWFKYKWVHEYDSGFKDEHGNKHFFQYPLGSEDFFGAKSTIIGNIHTTRTT